MTINLRAAVWTWQLMDRLARKWRGLDQVVRDGRHHQVMDRVIANLRGSNALHPHRFYADGFGDLTLKQQFRLWLDSFDHREGRRPYGIPAIDMGPAMPLAGVFVREARFPTTALGITDILPPESRQARMMIVSPTRELFPDPANARCAILLAGTGEHGYSRRSGVAAIPLAQRSGITGIILESPYYGARKPRSQVASKLRMVADLIVLGRATIEESCSILDWLCASETGPGLKNVALAGVSMGGLHSAMTASLTPHPVGVVSWLGPPSASPVFTEGLLATFCEWTQLQKDVAGDQVLARQVMSDFLSLTDIDNFPAPVAPERSIFVIAEHDCYVPPEVAKQKWRHMQQGKWKGARVEAIPGGHVSSTLFGAETFRRCVEDVLGLKRWDGMH